MRPFVLVNYNFKTLKIFKASCTMHKTLTCEKKIDHLWCNMMNHFEASVGETKTPVEGFAVSSLEGIWSERSFLPWTWILCFSMYALISWPFSVSCFSNVSINFASWKKNVHFEMVIYASTFIDRFYQTEIFVNLTTGYS